MSKNPSWSNLVSIPTWSRLFLSFRNAPDAHKFAPLEFVEQRHGWHGMYCCAVQTAHPSVRLHSSFCLKHVGCNALFVYKHKSTALCSNTFELCSSLYTSIGLQPYVSKPFELWILVCVWMGTPCLSISISLQPCVSDTFSSWLPVCVHTQTPVLCSNTFGLWLLVCVHASVNSPLFQIRLIVVACLLTLPPTPK